MNKTKLIAWVVLAAAVIALAFFGYETLTENYLPENSVSAEETSEEAPEKPEPAPDFTVYDTEGNAVKLSDFTGKPVVINFWATWCGYCVAGLPDFQAIHEEYGDEVVIMMVNSGEDEAKVRDFFGKKGYDMPLYFDSEKSAVSAYGAYSLPATAFINADGSFAHGRIGKMPAENLRAEIEKLIAK